MEPRNALQTPPHREGRGGACKRSADISVTTFPAHRHTQGHVAQHMQQLAIRLHRAQCGDDVGSPSRFSTWSWKWFSPGELEASMTAG